MLNAIQILIELAESSPGFDDPGNRAEVERAKPLVLGAHRLLEAAQLLLERWEQGNLSQHVQTLAAAVNEASGPGEFPCPFPDDQ